MDYLPDIRARNKWCILILYKFREAMVTLHGMLGQYEKAVKLALKTNMVAQACLDANREETQNGRKKLWLEIAKELLWVKQHEFEDQQTERAKTHLRECLQKLLSSNSCLKIEDLLVSGFIIKIDYFILFLNDVKSRCSENHQ